MLASVQPNAPASFGSSRAAQKVLRVLGRVGYDDALAIENEDASVTPHEGVELGAAFMRPLLAAAALA